MGHNGSPTGGINLRKSEVSRCRDGQIRQYGIDPWPFAGSPLVKKLLAISERNQWIMISCYFCPVQNKSKLNLLMEILSLHIYGNFLRFEDAIMAGVNRKFDFDDMTVDELWQLHEKLSQVLSVRLTSEKRELEKRLAQLRREKETGPSEPAEMVAAPRERRKYPRVLPKYQNPDEPSETWSGRGKQPRWLTAALKTGHTIEEFLIKKAEATQPSMQRRQA
jgi:DNA-binding protein H-NS